MKTLQTLIKKVKHKVEYEDFMDRHIRCDHQLLGTLIAAEREMGRLIGENKDLERVIKYLRERGGSVE